MLRSSRELSLNWTVRKLEEEAAQNITLSEQALYKKVKDLTKCNKVLDKYDFTVYLSCKEDVGSIYAAAATISGSKPASHYEVATVKNHPYFDSVYQIVAKILNISNAIGSSVLFIVDNDETVQIVEDAIEKKECKY